MWWEHRCLRAAVLGKRKRAAETDELCYSFLTGRDDSGQWHSPHTEAVGRTTWKVKRQATTEKWCCKNERMGMLRVGHWFLLLRTTVSRDARSMGYLGYCLQCMLSDPHLDGHLGESLSPPAMARPLFPTGRSHWAWEVDVLFTVKDTELGKGWRTLSWTQRSIPDSTPSPDHEEFWRADKVRLQRQQNVHFINSTNQNKFPPTKGV